MVQAFGVSASLGPAGRASLHPDSLFLIIPLLLFTEHTLKTHGPRLQMKR